MSFGSPRSKKRVDALLEHDLYSIDDSLAYVRVGLLLLMSYYMRPKQVLVRCELSPPRDVGEDVIRISSWLAPLLIGSIGRTRHREEARGMKALTALVCSYLEADAGGRKRGDSSMSYGRQEVPTQAVASAGIQGVARIMPILL